MTITGRIFIALTGLALLNLGLPTRAPAAPEPQPPNFLIIYFDDTGWTDFGCYGGVVPTPNIDHLASQGMRFTDYYAPAPNCSPSRAGLLTGRTPSRTGMYSYIPAGHPMHLPAKEITVAELLKGAGYDTGHFGKWHLSELNSEQPQPSDQGFDYSFGTDNNADKENPDNFIRNGVPVGETVGFACQLVVEETVGWIKERSGKPFVAYVCFQETHTPWGAPADLIEEYKRKYPADPKKATYLAMVANTDRAVGSLMSSLDEMGLFENTFVLLTSDNGPTQEFSRGELREKKSWVYEGGIREPAIIRWPGHVEPGSVCEEPVGSIDVLPTFCEIAGIAAPDDRPIDGSSILSVFEGKPVVRETPLFWYFYRTKPAAAMREGDWVILAELDEPDVKKTHWLSARDVPAIKSTKLTNFELYNLREDISQRDDRSGAEARRLAEMKATISRLHAEVVAEGPAWDIPKDYGRK